MSGFDFQPYFFHYPYSLAWAVLAALPPLLILLYFLKLKRRPLEVPSTFLWHRTIEDLHVNAIWQRLRQSLLLFLQLLFFALIALALFGPGMKGRESITDRIILLIDTSASMSATDVNGSRLDDAKKQSEQIINAMDDNAREAVAMIISFSDSARVEQTFTKNKNILLAKLKAISPTTHTSSLDEALRAAAGLANPGRTGDASVGDVPAANPEPATMYVLSDGGFTSIPDFQQGTLTTKYLKIGDDAAENVAFTGFSTERNPENGKLQAFARVENYGPKDVSTNVTLFVNGEFRDAKGADLPARGERPGAAGVEFDLHEEDDGILRLELDHKDQLAIDNTAFAVLNATRPARILVVSDGQGVALRLALETEEAQKISQTTFVKPSYLEDKKYQDDAASGVYDLIIYDRCAPKTPPQANTLFLGLGPPFEGWPAAEPQGTPTIIDIDRVHPLTQLIDLSNVLIGQTSVIRKPKGGLELIEADVGPIYTVAPRQSYEDAALGFSLIGKNKDGEVGPITDWPRRKSFPVFVMNAVKYLGGTGGGSGLTTVRPGATYPIRTVLPVDSVKVTLPNKRDVEVRREGQNVINFSQTDEPGVYEVREGSGAKLAQQFSVNLFDPRESDLKPNPDLKIGHDEIKAEAKASNQSARKELWKWILLLGLGIVLFEWYIYNRRVYL
jgi:uncharacterized protein YegL